MYVFKNMLGQIAMMRSIIAASTVIALFIANVSNADPVPEKLDWGKLD